MEFEFRGELQLDFCLIGNQEKMHEFPNQSLK